MFLPHYITADMQLPTEYKLDFDLFFDWFAWHFKWTNIQYDTPDLDIRDIKMEFTRGYDRSLIKFDFPAIKKWVISAH